MAPVLQFKWKEMLLRLFLWILKELLDEFDGGEAEVLSDVTT